MTTLRRGLAGAALAALALTATACNGGGEAESGTADASGGAVAREGTPGIVSDDAASGGGTTSAPGPGVSRTIVSVRSVVKTGEVAVTNEDLDAARAELDDILLTLDGMIDSESTQHNPRGRIEHSTLVLRVPVDRFKDAMAALERLGTARHSDTSSRDVTTEVIDIGERVETLENSLDRLQSYQEQAADIDDLIRYEQQITEREAELQSLKSQQAYLADQTSMSTITLYLSVPEKFAPPPGTLDDAGFLAGLKSGWNALQGTVLVVLTVVGAVLPFALVLALVGVPLGLLVRRSLRSRPAPATVPEAPAD